MYMKLVYILYSGFYYYIPCLIAWKIENKIFFSKEKGCRDFPRDILFSYV